MQSHIRKVHACLAITCHLHFWQNDWDLLRAAGVTRGWNGYDSVQKVDPGEKNCEEKGEPKQIGTDVPLLTSLPPYR